MATVFERIKAIVVEQLGVDEAYDHHGRGRARLDDRRGQHSGAHPAHAVGRHLVEQ